MGKKSREKMLGKEYVDNAKKLRDTFLKLVDKSLTYEDYEAIMKLISKVPFKLEIIPKKENVKDFHIRFIKRLMDRKLGNRLNCYISEDGKSVILEV